MSSLVAESPEVASSRAGISRPSPRTNRDPQFASPISPRRQALTSDGLLLVTASIWGFAFVAQRLGMQHVGPFGFTGVRFALGCLVLLPILSRTSSRDTIWLTHPQGLFRLSGFGGGLLAGVLLFLGASFQQVALVYTTASNAGFITGLYVVLVPIIGIALGQRTHAGAWVGAVLATVGLYFLSVTAAFTVSRGDILVFVGAIFWACHVHLIGWLSPRRDPLRLAFLQYAICSALSLSVSVATELNTTSRYLSAAIPILYGGVLSVGVAYTLQVVAQKRARPAHAAIIMSLESVFAALGGWLVLGEILTRRAQFGCVLMFCGMLVSQLWKTSSKTASLSPG